MSEGMTRTHSISRRGLLRMAAGGAALVGAGLVQGWPAAARALRSTQQPARVYRIGLIAPASGGITEATAQGDDPQDSPQHRAFRQRLAELGYIDGANLIIAYRYAQGPERTIALAAELAALPVDVIVTQSTVTGPAIQAAGATPVVFAVAADPVASGYVPSLTHPGGTVAGAIGALDGGSGRRLTLLKEAVPSIRHLAALWYGFTPATLRAQYAAVTLAAQSQGITVDLLGVQTPDELASALDAIMQSGADGLTYYRAGPTQFGTDPGTAEVVDWANFNRLPAAYAYGQFAEGGGLMVYTFDVLEEWRQAADEVAQILQGAYPGDLPVEEPTEFQLIINLSAAQALGITIPQSVLDQATELIGP